MIQHLARRARLEVNFDVTVTHRLTRVCRETGEVLGTQERKNAFTTAGKELLVDLIHGASNNHLDNSNSTFIALDSGSSRTLEINGCQASYPTTPVDTTVTNPQATATWRFADETANSYDASQAQLYYGDPDSGGTQVATDGATGWGTKPTTENWYYEWDISITGGDSNWDADGLVDMIGCITGAETTEFDGTEGSTNMYIRVSLSAGGPLDINIAAAATQPTSTSILWPFTNTNGGAARTWTVIDLYFKNPGSGGQLVYSDNISDTAQNNGDTITYDFTASFS